MVLAAGMGSRYGGLKQVDPVGPNGETILDYSVYDAMKAGFGRVVFIIRRDIEEVFREKIGKKFEARIPVEYVFQSLDDLPEGFTVPAGREKPWGTAHAVWVARDVVKSNFAVVNADDYYGRRSYELLSSMLSTLEDVPSYAMVGYQLGKTLSDHGHVNRAVCRISSEGLLEQTVETLKIEPHPDDRTLARYPEGDGFEKLSRDTVVSMNMFGFTPSFFGFIEEAFVEFLSTRREEEKSELYIPTVVNRLIADGRATMKVLRSEDSWFGVTYSDDKPHVVAAVKKLIDAGVYPTPLWGAR